MEETRVGFRDALKEEPEARNEDRIGALGKAHKSGEVCGWRGSS